MSSARIILDMKQGKSMAGVLYGVGVGPGNPELVTLKAVRIINECEVIGIPAEDVNRCTAFSIIKGHIQDMEKKQLVSVAIPMTTAGEKLERAYETGVNKIVDILKAGKSVAFLNLGDPTVYSTYMNIHKKVKALGYDAEIVSGITSFCAVAGATDMIIGKGRGSVHILPGYYNSLNEEYFEECIKNGDTLVLMKSASELSDIKSTLLRVKEKYQDTVIKAVTNCGMPNEKIVLDVNEIDGDSGYFTTIIVNAKDL